MSESSTQYLHNSFSMEIITILQLVGENLESEKYLIDVESEIQQAVNLEGEKQSIPSSVVLNKNEGYASVGIKKNILSSRTGFGLKRKHGVRTCVFF